jgi:hypothetical protein
MATMWVWQSQNGCHRLPEVMFGVAMKRSNDSELIATTRSRVTFERGESRVRYTSCSNEKDQR